MTCKALILSSPTIDIINISGNERTCAGGPPLYSGYALRKMDCDVYFYGPIGYETLKTVKLQEMLNIVTLGKQIDARGAVFYHKYIDSNRLTKLIGEIKAIDINDTLEKIYSNNFDFVIVSPIFNEVPPQLTGMINVPIVLDAQGYVRSIKNWIELLPSMNFNLIHLSSDDIPLSKIKDIDIKNRILFYTMGLESTIIIENNEKIELKPIGSPVNDRTGAGDIITALISYYYFYKRMNIVDSYINAQNHFESIINEISQIKYKLNEL